MGYNYEKGHFNRTRAPHLVDERLNLSGDLVARLGGSHGTSLLIPLKSPGICFIYLRSVVCRQVSHHFTQIYLSWIMNYQIYLYNYRGMFQTHHFCCFKSIERPSAKGCTSMAPAMPCPWRWPWPLRKRRVRAGGVLASIFLDGHRNSDEW